MKQTVIAATTKDKKKEKKYDGRTVVAFHGSYSTYTYVKHTCIRIIKFY